MKRSSSAAKLPQAMSNKLICLHIEILFMAKYSTWHVGDLFINAFPLKFRMSNSTAPKTACSSKIPKTKKHLKTFSRLRRQNSPLLVVGAITFAFFILKVHLYLYKMERKSSKEYSVVFVVEGKKVQVTKIALEVHLCFLHGEKIVLF